MTEHAAVIFVFFFLAEYASILLICSLMSVLFLGGYLSYPFIVYYSFIFNELLHVVFTLTLLALDELALVCLEISYLGLDSSTYSYYVNDINTSLYIGRYDLTNPSYKEYISMESLNTILSDPLIEGILYGFSLGLKTCIMIFVFIWTRASFPRIRFDQLMSFCWTILLPLVISFIIVVPCALHSFLIIPSNIFLL